MRDESQALTTKDEITAAGLEQVIVGGDLSKLSPGDRLRYYETVCRTLGLNPLTKPFEYIVLNGRMVLYARRDCTDQLRKINHVNITGLVREKLDDVYLVTASASTADGRRDESIGAVSIGGLRGEALANAMMKAETKAKRRVTLSIVGLGWLDETELETIPSAVPGNVNTETGEIGGTAQIPPPRPSPTPAQQPPGRTASRKDLATRYATLVDRADGLEVPAKMYNPAWTDQELVDEGMALGKAVGARENQLAKAG